jgi:hypothetical protein
MVEIHQAKADGLLSRDKNFVAIQTAWKTEYQDATGTPQVSPLAVSSTPIAIVVPTGAIKLSLYTHEVNVRFGDNAFLDAAAALKGYALAVDGLPVVLPVCAGETVYVMRDGAVDAVLYFHFEMLRVD